MGPSKLNAAANYLNFVVLAVLGLIINPMLLTHLGSTTFGIWKACQRFLDFATVADGRATQALKWVIAFRSGEAGTAEKQQDVGATLIVWLIWLPVLLLISGGIVLALPSLIKNLEPGLVGLVRYTGIILTANIVLSGLLSIPDSVLVGTNQGYRSMTITTAVLVLSNLAMLAVAWLGYGIAAIAGVVMIGSVVNGGLTWLVARRRVSWWGIRRPQRADVSRIAKFSGWVLAWSFVTKLFLSTELILLSTLVGAVAVSTYTFTSYVSQFALSICLMTTSAFMPKLGSLIGKGETNAARQVVAESREITLAIALVAGAGILLCNRTFVTLWAGAENYMGDTLNGLMVLAFVQLALIRADAQIQDASLNIRTKVLVGMTGSVASIVIAGAMYHFTGSIAAMYLGMIAGRLVVSVVFPLLVGQVIEGASLRLKEHALTAAVLVACYCLGVALPQSNLLLALSVTLVAIAIVLFIAYALILSKDTRAKIYSRQRKTIPASRGSA